MPRLAESATLKRMPYCERWILDTFPAGAIAFTNERSSRNLRRGCGRVSKRAHRPWGDRRSLFAAELDAGVRVERPPPTTQLCLWCSYGLLDGRQRSRGGTARGRLARARFFVASRVKYRGEEREHGCHLSRMRCARCGRMPTRRPQPRWTEEPKKMSVSELHKPLGLVPTAREKTLLKVSFILGYSSSILGILRRSQSQLSHSPRIVANHHHSGSFINVAKNYDTRVSGPWHGPSSRQRRSGPVDPVRRIEIEGTVG